MILHAFFCNLAGKITYIHQINDDMKKIVLVLIGILMSIAVNSQSQMAVYLEKFSETEVSNSTNGNFQTVEDIFQNFTDMYGNENIETMHEIISKIESGEIDQYYENIHDETLKRIIRGLKIACTERLVFTRNGKIYAITYEPLSDVLKTNIDNFDISLPAYKNLYLYRRDNNGWKKASNLIRRDYFIKGDSLREAITYTVNADRDEIYYSMLTRADKHGTIIVTLESENGDYIKYNTIITLFLRDSEYYHADYYEPSNLTRISPYGKQIPTLYGTGPFEVKVDDNYIIFSYWDGKNNPFRYGKISFSTIGYVKYLPEMSTINLIKRND